MACGGRPWYKRSKLHGEEETEEREREKKRRDRELIEETERKEKKGSERKFDKLKVVPRLTQVD